MMEDMIMTKETFDMAKSLDDRIKHLTEAIDKLNWQQYRLDPPSRMSGFYIATVRGMDVTLSEEETVCIIRAFENLRDNLREEFRKL